MYLVTEWTTMSAPRDSGCCSAGEANVLSTTRVSEWERAMADVAAMSITLRVGLVGVSSQII